MGTSEPQPPQASPTAKRFGGVFRLYGAEGFQRIQNAHVIVIGIGGVGSWAAEMLARSGVGKLSLVDMDDVCESNINRQVHAVQPSIGQAKVTAMADRIRMINPDCEVVERHEFFTQSNCDSILSGEIDYVFDAIDSLRHKIILLKACKWKKIPVLVSGGAGGRKDPTKIQITDLSRSINDKLLQKMRKELRANHGYPRNLKKKFGAECVFSPELANRPYDASGDCVIEPGSSLKLDCASGFGTAGYVTACFGMVASGRIVDQIATRKK